MRPFFEWVVIMLLAFSMSTPAFARPISYAEGWTFIETSNRASSAALVHYTPISNVSVGARYEWMRGADIRLQALQPTYLAKRWFGQDYQANLYLTGGIGRAKAQSRQDVTTETATFAGIMADWETRSLFASYEMRAIDLGQLGNQTMHAARVGWAPYEGDTGDLHTWLMLEVDRREHFAKATTVTPLLRFFKGPALLELGYNLGDSKPLINFTFRF